MNRKEEQTSRRDFLKQGARAAAASMVAGLGAHTAQGAGRKHKKITFGDALPTRSLGKTGVTLPMLGYGGGALFVVVLLAGIIQPRFLHPKWYGDLEDRLGKKAMVRLKGEAVELDVEEWQKVTASRESFDAWVDDVLPQQLRKSRGFKRD